MRKSILKTNLMRPRTLLFVLAVSVLVRSSANAAAVEGTYARVALNEGTGEYQLQLKERSWSLAGAIGMPVDAPQASDGNDAAGKFVQLSFDSGNRSNLIRAYQDRPIILFSYTLKDAVTQQPPARFLISRQSLRACTSSAIRTKSSPGRRMARRWKPARLGCCLMTRPKR
jgi:hypothetical protein